MSDMDRTQSDTEAARCITAGCGASFDPTCEGFNGECDCCAALAADHFTGAHSGLGVECRFCNADDPAGTDQVLAIAA
jgi:hypothetical protein